MKLRFEVGELRVDLRQRVLIAGVGCVHAGDEGLELIQRRGDHEVLLWVELRTHGVVVMARHCAN